MTGDPNERNSCESRLDEAVAEYLLEVEAGRVPDRAKFLAHHPDLADDLAAFLDDRDLVGGVIESAPTRVAHDTPAAGTCPHCHGRIRWDAATASCPGCGARFRLDSSDAARPLAARLGRFELTAVAGRGAFGTVYKAWDPDMNRPVAVKVPRRGAMTTPDDTDRFLREARFTVRLHHPNIVRTYEVGEAEGIPYLVSEFVLGRTLADHLRDRRPPPDRAAELVAAVADALHHAHQNGVVHRDVKPSNILLRWDETPALTDFGLARQDEGEETITLDGEILGTPAYMSPEQARGGSRRVDGRTDVYSLGAVLYQLLTGEHPFVGNARMVLHQILHDEPRPPRRLNDRLPRDLETVCLKCLRKDPARRYRTAAELADDLRRFRDRRPVLARPEGRVERLARWVRRNPALATAGVLAAALLTATAAVSAAWAVHADRQADAIRRALDDANRVTAETELDRGLDQADRGEVGPGMLWMARSLGTAPEAAGDLAWTIRASLGAWRRELFALTDCAEPPPGRVLGLERDGRHGWVADRDLRSVSRWNLTTRQSDGPILKHAAPVSALAVSPDGRQVATGCAAGNQPVRLWDAGTGEEVSLPGPHGEVRGLAFLPDGRGLVTATAETMNSTIVRVCCVPPGGPQAAEVRHPGYVEAIAVSPDGTALFVVDRLGRTVRGYELATGRRLDWALPHLVPVKALAISPDARHLLTAGDDRATRVWDRETGRPVGVFHHREAATAVGYSADGRTLVTASPGDAVRFWHGSRASGSVEVVAMPDRARVRALAVSPAGDIVATGSDDRLVRLWRTGSGHFALWQILPAQPSPIKFVCFSPDGRLVAASTFQRDGARVWEVETGKEWATLNHPARVHSVTFGPRGERAATAAFANDVLVWDTAERNPARAPPVTLRHGQTVLATAFSPDGRVLVTGGADGVARRWDVATGALLDPVLPHDGPIRVIAFGQDGRLVMTAGGHGARLWRADTGAAHAPPLLHGYEVRAATFGPGGRSVITGGQDRVIRLWDADTGRPRGLPLYHADAVWVVASDPTGRWAVSGSDDGTGRLWAAETGRPLGPPLAHEAEVKCAGIDPAGRWVVTAGLDGTIRRWPAPAAPDGSAARLAAWVEVVTGTELDPAGAVHVLTPDAWHQSRRHLQDLGGPPGGQDRSPGDSP